MPQPSPNIGGGIFSALSGANVGGGLFGSNPAQDFGSQVTGNAGFANTPSAISGANFNDPKFLKPRK
jgi:hypothetical protein